MASNNLNNYIQMAAAAIRAAYGDLTGVALIAVKNSPKVLALLFSIILLTIILPAFMIQSIFTGDKNSLSGTFSEMSIEALEYREDWIKILALVQTKKILSGVDYVNVKEAGAALINNNVAEFLEANPASQSSSLELYNNNLELLESALSSYAGYVTFYDEIPAPASYQSINIVYNPSSGANELVAYVKVKTGTIKKDVSKRIFEDIDLYITNPVILYSSNDVVSYKAENGRIKIKYRKFGLSSYFPISSEYNASFSNDFGNERIHDGDHDSHEGTDIFAVRGAEIVSIEDCIIEKIGWNSFGGWRITLASKDGKREYYYAHMEDYAPRFQKYKDTSGKVYENPGIEVKAGELIGYVGSSGGFNSNTSPGSDTGTPPHLHLQMWVKSKGWFSDKMTLINPYYGLKLLEHSKFSNAIRENKEKIELEGL